MITIKKQFIILVLFLVFLVSNIQAQVTYSPYSMLGLGEIENKDYGRTSGMSNLGIGVRDVNYLNSSNPAGISGLDSLQFIFDISVAGKQSYFSRKGKTDDAFNGNLKKILFGFRLTSRWGISLGVKPFSDVGYQIYSKEPIEGSTSTKDVYIEGSGGLYELCLSNGIKISDNFSVGINSKFISGTLKQTEDQTESLFQKESKVSLFYNTFGAQYYTKGFTLGATYGYKQNITMSNKTVVYDSEYTVVEENRERSTNQFIPETFGVGFSKNSKKLIWGLDFQYQKWGGLESNVSSVKIVDSYRINAGLGYIPKSERYYKVRTQGQIQVGTSLSKSYIQVSGKNAYNYSVSAGYSLPADKGGVLLNFAVEYGNTFSAPVSYIKESYIMLTLNCSTIDKWFKKNRIK